MITMHPTLLWYRVASVPAPGTAGEGNVCVHTPITHNDYKCLHLQLHTDNLSDLMLFVKSALAALFPPACRTILAIPIIDGVDWSNFRYNPVYQGKELFRGIFEWGFLYKESKVPDTVLQEREHVSEPYR